MGQTMNELDESADNYQRVIAVLNDRWRVAICANGWQFLLQRRVSSKHPDAWRSLKFSATAAHLRTVVREYCGEIDPDAARTLAALPPRASLAAMRSWAPESAADGDLHALGYIPTCGNETGLSDRRSGAVEG